MIEDWFRGILTDGILSNLSGLFDSVNTEVGEIASQVGTTPAGWNAGIFNMIDVYKRQVCRWLPIPCLAIHCRRENGRFCIIPANKNAPFLIRQRGKPLEP